MLKGFQEHNLWEKRKYISAWKKKKVFNTSPLENANYILCQPGIQIKRNLSLNWNMGHLGELRKPTSWIIKQCHSFSKSVVVISYLGLTKAIRQTLAQNKFAFYFSKNWMQTFSRDSNTHLKSSFYWSLQPWQNISLLLWSHKVTEHSIRLSQA